MNGHHTGDEADFMPPHSPADGGVMLAGRWRIEQDGVTAKGQHAGAEIRYHARSLYAVLSLDGAKQVKVYLFQDGEPLPKDGAGSDVKFDEQGSVRRGHAGPDVLPGAQSEVHRTSDVAESGWAGLDAALVYVRE